MIYGAVDVGTNSTRLLIAEVTGSLVKTCCFRLYSTRLGAGIEHRYLQPAAIKRVLDALKDIRFYLREYQVKKVKVVATSAVREAKNAVDFLRRVRDIAGFSVEVISGLEEARLTYKGISAGLWELPSPIVIDIGGGSTEFIYASGSKPIYESISVGAVRLTENPQLVDEILLPMREVITRLKTLDAPLVGVGGTVTSLAAVAQGLKHYEVERVHGYHLKKIQIERILIRLSAKTIEERRLVPGLQPSRADIIIAGTFVLWVIMMALEQNQIIVSEADILQGMVLELKGDDEGV